MLPLWPDWTYMDLLTMYVTSRLWLVSPGFIYQVAYVVYTLRRWHIKSLIYDFVYLWQQQVCCALFDGWSH